MRLNKRVIWTAVVLLLVFAAMNAMLLSVYIGDMKVKFGDISKILKQGEGIQYEIITKLRIPRAILAFAVGSALSLSGALLQGIYRNPLVEPYTLGISGGASLGIALCITLGLNLSVGTFTLPLLGFVGALTTIFLVYTLSSKRSYGLNINKMLLIGVMISFIASSIMMFLMSVTSAENLHNIIFWTMGSLNEPNTSLIKAISYISFFGLIVSMAFATDLNALRLGEVKAKHLGINTSQAIKVLFVVASLLTGISVSIVGVIGFVGLIIPHLMRLVVGTDYRILLVSTYLGGGIFLILCDIVARTIILPNELPIGVITGIIGGVIFIFALSRTYKTKLN